MPNAPLKNVPMEWVRAFEAAGRLGNFTAAAKETGLTQAAISQRIGKLEQKIGAHLFDRKARGVTLTIDGEAWLPYVSNAFAALNRSAQELFTIQRKHLTITASTSIIDLWITPRLNQLQKEEQMQFSFKTMLLSSDPVLHEKSVKILYGVDNWTNVYKAPIYKEIISPVVSRELSEANEKWYNLPRIVLAGPRPSWKEWILETGDPATPVPFLRFDTFSSALSAARRGLGVLLASLPLCEEDLRCGALVRVSEKTLKPESTYWLLASDNAISAAQWHTMKAHFTVVNKN